jgi:hypothetical protein
MLNLYFVSNLLTSLFMKRRFIKLFIVFLLLSLMTYKSYLLLTDGFSVKNIVFEEKKARWEISYTGEEIKDAQKILNQPFRYLAKGRQCYAFESEDGQYVLKFMKCQRFKTSWFSRWLPNSARKIKKKSKSKKALFSSYFIAKNECPKETALLFLQLNAKSLFHKKVQLIDKLGRIHEVDIDKTPFVIQKKITPVFTALQRVLEKGDSEQACSLLKQITDVIATLSKRGIRDADAALIKHNNLGFEGDSIAYIDIGTFKHVSRKKRAKFLRKDYQSLDRLCDFLERQNPELACYVKQEIAQAIAAAQELGP